MTRAQSGPGGPVAQKGIGVEGSSLAQFARLPAYQFGIARCVQAQLLGQVLGIGYTLTLALARMDLNQRPAVLDPQQRSLYADLHLYAGQLQVLGD